MALDLRAPHPLPPGVDRPEKVSFSALKHFDTCPYSAALYWKYGGGAGSHPMDRGSAFHIWAEVFIRALVEAGEREVSGEVGRDLMGQVITENPSLVLPAHEQEALRLMAWNAAECWSVDPAALYCLETMYEARVGDFIVRGRIDRADFAGGILEVVDSKTSRYVPAQEKVQDVNEETGSKVTGPEAFQLALYSLLLVFGRPEGEPDHEPLGGRVKEVAAAYEYPRFRVDDRLLRRTATFNHTDLEDFAQVLRGHLEKIEQGFQDRELPAVSGTHCGRCPSPRECPIPPHLVEVLPPRDDNDAQTLMALHNDLEARKARVQEGLKAHVAEHGAVHYGDQTFDFQRVDKNASVKPKHREEAKQLQAEGKPIPPEFYGNRSTSTRFQKQTREKWEKAA